jgi:hypothetical protein
MRSNVYDVIADLEAGRVVSPRRIKALIRVKKTVLDGFLKLASHDAGYAADARSEAEKTEKEIAGYEGILAGAEDVLDRLNRAMPGYRDGKSFEAIRNMRLEWEAEAAGFPHYVRHIKPGAVDIDRAV